jgi:hypothetical protein
MTASSAGEEGCSLVPEGPTRPAMALALEVVEGLEDEVWWVGLPRFRSRSRVAHLMQMLLIAGPCLYIGRKGV